MRISAIRLRNVRQFVGAGVALEGIGQGVNLFVAANESGKSTTFDALHALFFQPHTSRAQAVQALKPYAGGSPVVEADIETDGGRFRLSKRFLARASAEVLDLSSGRLVAQADEAEAFIAGLVRGGTAGPAGLLWVRQGVTGLDRGGKGDDKAERQARESVLASVQGEVEAITGGRRMQEVQAACDADLARLVTETGRAKAGGAYHAAIQASEEARAAEARLRHEVDSLHDELRRRAACRARLAEIDAPEERTARDEALALAALAVEEAKARGAALKSAGIEAAHAGLVRDHARTALNRFREALARHETAARRRETATAARRQAAERQQDAGLRHGTAADAVTQAEREEEEARTLLARLDRALAARNAADRIAEARGRLDRAEKARAEAKACEARLKVDALPAKALETLEEAELGVATLRAAARMAVPRLAVTYEPGAGDRFSLDGIPLEEGVERTLGPLATIEVVGVGRVKIAGPARDGDAAILAAVNRHRESLARLGVESLADARRRDEAARGARIELDRANALVAALAPEGLAALRETVAGLANASRPAAPEPPGEVVADPATARAALDAGSRRVAESRLARRAIETVRDEAARGLAAADIALAGLDAEIAALADALGPDALRAERAASLSAAVADSDAAAAAAQAMLAPLQRDAIDVETAEAAHRRARAVKDMADAEAARLRETLAGLDAAIGLRADEAVEEIWQEARETLAGAEQRAARFEREVAVLARLRRALDEARAAAREHYFRPVMRELAPLMRLLFDDAAVVFDDETLQPSRVTRRGQEERIEVLSGGTREQLAILTRLAFARLLAADGRAAPVILDDAIVYSDDERIERMFDALHREARDQQVIVLSCRQRAFSRLGGNALAFTPWTLPDDGP